MRLVTWNMGYWNHSRMHERAWQWLLNELRPDVMLLQECLPPRWAYDRGTLRFERPYPNSGQQRWGTALFTTLPTEPAVLPEAETWLESVRRPDVVCFAAKLQGWCVSSKVQFPGGPNTLIIALHNPAYPIAPELLQDRDVSAIKLNLSKNVWLLDVLFYFLRQRLQSGESLLVGGDFNYSRLLDHPKPRGNAEFFDRLRAEGFVSLHRLFHDHDEQTFFHSRRREH